MDHLRQSAYNWSCLLLTGYASCMAKKLFLTPSRIPDPRGASKCEAVMVRSPYAMYPIARVCRRDDGSWGYSSVGPSPHTLHGRKRTKMLAVKAAVKAYKSWIG